ncbi:hypothetical protein [Xanthomonas rydalmerensis]|uniref:Uncharacterized protein n=1 Tax=Xanthomonas rydalmerensis TaxID=3046274 RepID=A0ABZ0JNB3_9XANT|nr:hypothetical protein [Xanthomonas sp. DM-2023]WOS41150.1 hypothetical protein QN243_01305 [Xanthomonas sp. DM-2023]WOS45335.1 hypothetical protein QN242_01305 [Xanthomonas sp. DM-2023]WOS49514.1 hypothetical protein QN240_01305 [Xanthomonas sp. DM-2023]WOS53694.1 hypothetical protein QN244_01305 [Xanthomonas sp. DM-2023]WOS57877.1 hypothetical protein QN245_01305 [Xanthomonas sp. DM-2023]
MKNMTLRNNTKYVAQFVVTKGQQVVARIPGIEPNSSMLVPTDNAYEVTATAVIDGNTYISAPLQVSGPTGFLAQVLQVRAQGTYEFNVVEVPSLNPSQLQFQKTCLSPVTFTITKNKRPLQSVVVNDSFEVQSLDISDTYYVYAVVNGVTTDTLTTSNPESTITASTDSSDLERGYATLDLG